MRVGIFGGSFNPIHKGHVALAKSLVKKGLVDEIWIMVSPLNPLKANESEKLLENGIRLQLAQMATVDTPCLKASDFEFTLPLPSYTVTTLEALQKTYRGYIFSLVIGEDNWQRFSHWFRSEEIRQKHDIIVYGRRDNAEVGTNMGAAVPKQESPNGQVTIHRTDGTEETYEGFPLYDVSSTQIRQALRDGNLAFARRWLHPDVYRELRQHKCFI